MNNTTDFPHETYEDYHDEDTKNANSTGDQEWTKQATFYLLEEILLKKWELHDPKHRYEKFYNSIRELLLVRGIDFTPRAIMKKFRSLKRTFDLLIQNKDREPKNWVFFDKMMEIFAEEMAIEDAPTMASLYPPLPLPKSALPQRNCEIASPIYQSDSDEFFDDTTAATPDKANKQKLSETVWSHKVVVDFLAECVAEREAFNDPGRSFSRILVKVSERLKDKGYNLPVETLHRKLTGLRMSYKKFCLYSKKKEGYPYFDQLNLIFNGWASRRSSAKSDVIKRRTRRSARTKKETKPKEDKPAKVQMSYFEDVVTAAVATTSNFRKILPKPDPFQQLDVTADVGDEFCTEIERLDSDFKDPVEFAEIECLQEAEDELESKFVPQASVSSEPGFDLEFARKLLALEERRTLVTEALVAEMEESNAIREKKLEFKKLRLAQLKARAKRKRI